MPSHSVRRLIALEPAPQPDSVIATVELVCGCRVTRTISEDRIVERPDGERFAVGKIPCPVGHPVRAPSS
ncbi:MAG: hypothetical protein H6712_05680 [Myxococcales bacterium]|nr:hypothetical protein [Myxococcales bacterium]MCB9713325.1 hypothetical protein [Myxococcales bacterium]